MLGFTVSIYKGILLQSVGSIVVDRRSLLPFNPTYVLCIVGGSGGRYEAKCFDASLQ